MSRVFKIAVCVFVLAATAGVVYNQEVGKEKKPAEKKADKPATHKVTAKPFKIELTVTGLLAGEEAAEIRFQPQPSLRPADGQGSLTIRKIAEHGATVKKGDLLAELDTTKLIEFIENLDAEQKSLATNLKLAEEELPLAEASAPLDLAAAEHAKKKADQELKYFLDIAKSAIERETNMMVTSAKFQLEYAEEEMAQLKKMYKANDLTEETERMILRRQKHWIERIAFWHEMAVLDRDYVFKYSLPEREKSLRDTQAKNELNWHKARKTTSLALAQKKAALTKMQQDYEKNAARLDKFRKDLAGMTLRSPMDGIVYHGRFHQGQWSASETLSTKLIPGGTVSPEEVFMTVVKPQPVVVFVSVDEKDVHLVKVGAEGTAKVTSRPDRKLAARVTKLSAAPSSPGKYAGLVQLQLNKDDADLLPGMACSIKFVPYAQKSAIVIASKYVHEEDGKDVVFVVTPTGKQEMRTVTKGRTHGDDTEIVSGLRDGEEILIERPSAKSVKGGTQ